MTRPTQQNTFTLAANHLQVGVRWVNLVKGRVGVGKGGGTHHSAEQLVDLSGLLHVFLLNHLRSHLLHEQHERVQWFLDAGCRGRR